MFPVVRAAARALPQASQALIQAQTRTILSGPPKVRISLTEKALHGMFLTASFFGIPFYILYNIPSYRQ
ncbi:PREDICTED: uncharacterized protein LOC108564025 [Nicrophorus vespilloides]|uniref:Uncharacterized protein LOC108564025 n=1 Tax=Nicrophorus vespilloides TaxID=110193 RepID=A0ABM1MUY4_NICVS|nr:PREDICTED: uncharacterized protein LOC108564025 [Nicrophorus vespilloides]